MAGEVGSAAAKVAAKGVAREVRASAACDAALRVPCELQMRGRGGMILSRGWPMRPRCAPPPNFAVLLAPRADR